MSEDKPTDNLVADYSDEITDAQIDYLIRLVGSGEDEQDFQIVRVKAPSWW